MSKTTTPPLIGKWVAADGESIEFAEDGTLVIVRPNLPPLAGKFKSLDKSVIEIDLTPILAKTVKAHTAVKGDNLSVVAKVVVSDRFGDEVDRSSQWKRAASLKSGQAPLHPTSKEALVGHWADDTDQDVYDFFPDGTFARHIPSKILPATHLGLWQLDPKSSATLQLTYPDTGRSESIRAHQSPGGVTLGRDYPPCAVAMFREEKSFARKADPSPERQPIQSKLLTAYQIHLEFKGNKEAAEKKYKDKEWEIGGIVRGYVTAGLFEFNRNNDKNKATNVQTTTVSLATGEDQNVFCVFTHLQPNDLGDNDPLFPSITKWGNDKSNPFQVGTFVIIKGKCVGLVQQTGFVTIGSNTPKVQFTQCTLISPALKEEKKKGDSK